MEVRSLSVFAAINLLSGLVFFFSNIFYIQVDFHEVPLSVVKYMGTV